MVATDDKIIRLIRTACWINKAPNTHPEHVRNYHYTLRNSPEKHVIIIFSHWIFGLYF
jgi:hypothetical protein